MSNVFDYVAWRGDITFGNAPLCPVDALIFSLLPYMRMEGIVPSSHRAEPVRLADAAKAYLARPTSPDKSEQRHNGLLSDLAASARFGSLRLLAARKEVDRTEGMQFAAITILLPGQNLFVAFEGTDDTLVGWKEDLRMSYECPVPAQLRAAAYLREAALSHPMRKIYVGGHSKGGNLAMYAAVYCGEEFRSRIRAVYNNDGPGFCDDTLSSAAYRELRPRIHLYVPEASIVGVLLEHDEEYKIVKSTARGLLQHMPFSWQVKGADFEYAAERTAFGRETEEIIDRFAADMSPERKRQLTEALFGILEATNYDTVSGIGENILPSARRILRSYTGLDPEVRALLNESLVALNRARREVRRNKSEKN